MTLALVLYGLGYYTFAGLIDAEDALDYTLSLFWPLITAMAVILELVKFIQNKVRKND